MYVKQIPGACWNVLTVIPHVVKFYLKGVTTVCLAVFIKCRIRQPVSMKVNMSR